MIKTKRNKSTVPRMWKNIDPKLDSPSKQRERERERDAFDRADEH